MKQFLLTATILLITAISFGQTLFVNINETQQIVSDWSLDENTAAASVNPINIDSGDTLTVLIDYGATTSVGSNYMIRTLDNTTNIIISTSTPDTIYTSTILANGSDYLFRFIEGGSNIYFKIHVTDPTANTSEFELNGSTMVVYPSPASSSTTVRFFADKTDIPLYIFSLNGAMVHSDCNNRMVGTENKIELDLTKFEKGTYLVKVGNLVEKLIVE